ncbi:uncharacterized protein LOC143146058 [Ptiloglossa arizonensis]|uniref:uncharacterized protein LOC143146058 n=1 Tax=Ptiloglossa arizonensis TaxID=3350558 RepID=UPI003F9FF4A9
MVQVASNVDLSLKVTITTQLPAISITRMRGEVAIRRYTRETRRARCRARIQHPRVHSWLLWQSTLLRTEQRRPPAPEKLDTARNFGTVCRIPLICVLSCTNFQFHRTARSCRSTLQTERISDTLNKRFSVVSIFCIQTPISNIKNR